MTLLNCTLSSIKQKRNNRKRKSWSGRELLIAGDRAATTVPCVRAWESTWYGCASDLSSGHSRRLKSSVLQAQRIVLDLSGMLLPIGIPLEQHARQAFRIILRLKRCTEDFSTEFHWQVR